MRNAVERTVWPNNKYRSEKTGAKQRLNRTTIVLIEGEKKTARAKEDRRAHLSTKDSEMASVWKVFFNDAIRRCACELHKTA